MAHSYETLPSYRPDVYKRQGTKKEIDRYLEIHNIPDTALHIVARMNDLEAIRKSVAGGLGISILSACSAKDLADTHQILMLSLIHI